MDTNGRNLRRRAVWLLSPIAAALLTGFIRKWQLNTAFEADTGLATPWAPASVVLACLLVMATAWFALLAVNHPIAKRPVIAGQVQGWETAFVSDGDMVYPILVILGAFLSLSTVPLLLKTGLGQWMAYQAAVRAQSHQPPSNNGVLTIATAVGALLAFLGLLLIGLDGLRPGRRGRGGFAAVMPGMSGCIWLMESFRGHAADPVQWDYAPLILAIVCGMLFYMDFTGVSAGTGNPRRLLLMAAVTITFAGPAAASALADHSMADVLLLLAHALTAAAVLWRLPPDLENPVRKEISIPRFGDAGIQEDTTDE